MDISEDWEASIPDSARKKPRLDEATDISSCVEQVPPDNDAAAPTVSLIAPKAPVVGKVTDDTDGPAAGGVDSEDAMDEDEDEDEEDNIGPGGVRSIQYCLNAFTTDEEDDGSAMCLLCLYVLKLAFFLSFKVHR
jgi:hypothetical protein